MGSLVSGVAFQELGEPFRVGVSERSLSPWKGSLRFSGDPGQLFQEALL